MDDETITALFYERSEQAIEKLTEKYGAVALRLARNILQDPADAEECVNDAYLAVWNTVPPQRPAYLGGYFCRITRNLAAKRYRANTAAKRNSRYDAALDELAACLPAAEDVESALEAREVSGAIDRFLDGLSYVDRFLFLRRYWFGDELADIAAETGLGPRRISVRLFRIREKLRRYLVKEGMLP